MESKISYVQLSDVSITASASYILICFTYSVLVVHRFSSLLLDMSAWVKAFLLAAKPLIGAADEIQCTIFIMMSC